MAAVVYILGTLVTLACALFLIRGYANTRRKLLLWSAICFFGLSVSNFLLFLDLEVFLKVDLYVWRLATAAIAMLFLLYGLIWEGNR
jgi:hypothetical protein